MPKIWRAAKGFRGDGHEEYLFDCPGCGDLHGVPVKRGSRYTGPVWEFNGQIDAPTFKPSLLIRYHVPEEGINEVCHSFVTDGSIQFLSDCTHKLAGQTIPLPEVEKS